MRRTNFNVNLIPPITALILAVSCEWDKEKILEIAADALTDANGHAEAQQLRAILERIRREG